MPALRVKYPKPTALGLVATREIRGLLVFVVLIGFRQDGEARAGMDSRD